MEDNAWAIYEGVAVTKALRSILRWRTTSWWRNRSDVRPYGRVTCGCHNRCVVWVTLLAKCVGEGKDWMQAMIKNPPRKEEMTVALLKIARQPTKHMVKNISEILSKEPRQLDPMILEDPEIGEGIQGKTVVDWIQGKAWEREERAVNEHI